MAAMEDCDSSLKLMAQALSSSDDREAFEIIERSRDILSSSLESSYFLLHLWKWYKENKHRASILVIKSITTLLIKILTTTLPMKSFTELQVKFSFSFLRNLSYLNMDLKESKELANFYKLGVGRLQVRYKSMEMYQAKILDDITFICHHGSQLDQCRITQLATFCMENCTDGEFIVDILEKIFTLSRVSDLDHLVYLLVKERPELFIQLSLEIRKSILKTFPNVIEHFMIREIGQWCLQNGSGKSPFTSLCLEVYLPPEVTFEETILKKIENLLKTLKPVISLVAFKKLEEEIWLFQSKASSCTP